MADHGQDEEDVRHPYYVASSDDLHFVTDGETFEELLVNIRECLDLTLKDSDSASEYHVERTPKCKPLLLADTPAGFLDKEELQKHFYSN